MANTLRFLILEDDPADAELMQRKLRRGGVEFDACFAVNRASYLSALDAGDFDLILADYQLPDMDGLEALELARERQAGVPLIVVTGNLGDEAAVETIKRGAFDYILKGGLHRLVPAVNRAVSEVASARERVRIEGLLRDSERQTAQTLSLLETLQSAAPVGFGFVDREFRNVRANDRLAAVSGFRAEEVVGRTVAEVVPDLWPQLEALYRHVFETGEAIVNQEITGETAEEPGRTHTWLTSYYPVSVANEIIGAGVVVVDITDLKEAARQRDDLTRAAAGAIAAAVEARDPYTSGHQRRVSEIAAVIAEDLQLDPDAIGGIRLAAEIHDIGKISVPAEILTRPGRLSHQEWELLKLHPQAGYDIVQGIPFRRPIAEMILQHHENIDGSGYPRRLRGDKILLGARVIRVADVLEAMSSHRPYRPARGVDAAIAEIEHGAGRLFDSDVAEACIRLHRQGRLRVEGWSGEETTRSNDPQDAAKGRSRSNRPKSSCTLSPNGPLIQGQVPHRSATRQRPARFHAHGPRFRPQIGASRRLNPGLSGEHSGRNG